MQHLHGLDMGNPLVYIAIQDSNDLCVVDAMNKMDLEHIIYSK